MDGRERTNARKERATRSRTHGIAVRDATIARDGPRIMYPEQEVEKIRRPVVINNPRLRSRGTACIPATPAAAVTPFYRAVITGAEECLCNKDDSVLREILR